MECVGYKTRNNYVPVITMRCQEAASQPVEIIIIYKCLTDQLLCSSYFALLHISEIRLEIKAFYSGLKHSNYSYQHILVNSDH